MRISDWSSDVCSSDRRRATDVERTHGQLGARLADRLRGDHADRLAVVDDVATAQVAAVAVGADAERRFTGDRRTHLDRLHAGVLELAHPGFKSEEHTSELQSLMRISYAVFCLKKKKK